jgi:stearoyl-CoA desaturase (delta-9 desaturase)
VVLAVVIGFSSAMLTAVITEVYAHRCLAHRAFSVHPALARFLTTYFRVIVWTDPETWAAVHRLHHRYADTPLDPHSPVQRPPLAILAGSPYLFAVARRRLPGGPPVGWRIVALRILVPGAYLVAFGPARFLVILGVHLVCYLGIMGLVNTVGHLYGRKPHPESPGYDIAWLAIPLLGHGYHNSHHAHPAAARTGPLDPVWPLLRGLAAARLVTLDERHSQLPCAVACRTHGPLAGSA